MTNHDPAEQKDRLRLAMRMAGLPERGGPAILARAMGISPQAIAQVLAGRAGGSRALTAYNTAKVAKYLKVDWFWLATGEGEPRPSQEPVVDEPSEMRCSDGTTVWVVPRTWLAAQEALKKAAGK